MQRIHWLCPERTHHHLHFFDVLSAESDGALCVYFEKMRSTRHPWRQVWPRRPWEAGYGERGFCAFLRALVLEPSSVFFVGGWGSRWAVLANVLAGFLGRFFVVTSDTPNTGKRRGPVRRGVRSALLWWIFRRAKYVAATGNVGVSAFIRMGLPPAKAINLPFFVDLEHFKPSSKAGSGTHPQDQLRFVSAGTLNLRAKRWDIPLKALEQVCSGSTSWRVRYVMAGDGPDRGRLSTLIRALRLDDVVQLAGWLEYEELPRFYQSGDVLLHAPTWDPFPVVVLEALACGLPVIGSTGAGSVLERVVHGVNGFIVRAGSVSDLAKAIERVVSNPMLLADMARRAREEAEKWPATRGAAELLAAISRAR